MFDYNKIYFKVTNENECHYDFQYKDGLNILPFAKSESCVPGGLYFTNQENISKFFNYGMYIRQVTIPLDAQIYKDTDKWRADKIILGHRYTISEFIIKYKIDAIDYAAENGHLKVIKY